MLEPTDDVRDVRCNINNCDCDTVFASHLNGRAIQRAINWTSRIAHGLTDGLIQLYKPLQTIQAVHLWIVESFIEFKWSDSDMK